MIRSHITNGIFLSLKPFLCYQQFSQRKLPHSVSSQEQALEPSIPISLAVHFS